MGERHYLPTFSDLVDRLSICIRKYSLLDSTREVMDDEIKKILHDLDLFEMEWSGELVELILTVGLLNNLIWENESLARKGEDQNLHLLRQTHGMNALRQKVKNLLQKHSNEPSRIELKHEYMAEDLSGIKIRILENAQNSNR